MKYLMYIVTLYSFNACLKIDCNKLKKADKIEECIIVVEDPPSESSWFEAKGYNPYSKKACECRSSNRWWSQYSTEIENGDTIIKKKGQLTFNIHKKDTVITHYWECEGKIYKD